RARSRSRQAETLPCSSNRVRPFSENSSAASFASSSTLVSDHNASSVIEIDPTAGTFRRASALPQYLISAKFAPARASATPVALLDVLIALEPIHRGSNREPRVAPAV